MSLLGPPYTCHVCDGFVNVPASYKGSGRCRCDEIESRDLDERIRKRFSGPAVHIVIAARQIPAIPLVTERPVRPRFGGLSGTCPNCGSRYFGCGCDD